MKKKVPKKPSPPAKRSPARERVTARVKATRPRRGRPSKTPVPAPVAVEPAAIVEAPPADTLFLETPEPSFATRVSPPEAERPFPSSRRAVFFDVENASRPEHISRVIQHLAVDRAGHRLDFVAVGNWRVIGHDTARLLARHGAHLVHSAPSVGVRDWSDLRIAVAAGVWLAGARPGDVLEIVTNDRAFDAVGDVAASLGIAFRRLSHQGLERDAEARAPVREAPAESRSRFRGRGRRRSGGGWRDRPSSPAAAPRPPAEAARAAIVEPEPEPPAPMPVSDEAQEAPVAEAPATSHTAPHDEIIAVVRDLMQRAPGRPVTLDSLANALKARGFSRPPGSPRLITRLRRIKEITLSRTGVITLAGEETAATPVAEVSPVVEPAVDAPEVVDLDEEGPQPGNEALPATAQPGPSHQETRRRWSRRGGRGRGQRPQPARAV